MAKQGGGLKRVDLKVSVNCCDGCRRKVLKALNLKGVLRTEVHPTADRVAVVGDVDSGRLVKRLAKVGKIAEVIEQPPPEGEKKKRDGGDGGDKSGNEPSLANEKIGVKGSDDGEDAGKPKHSADDKCAPKGAYAEAKNDTSGNGDAIVKEQQEGSRAGTAANGVSEGYHVKATMCYHRAEPEPAMVVPMHLPHYAANYTMPLPPPPYAYGIGGCYYGMPPPPYCRPPPVVRPQPTRFVDEDLFSDDNTVGCRVM